MTRIRWIVLLTLVGVGSVQAETTAACDPWAAKIASVQGTVEAKRSQQTDWVVVTQDEIYCAGDSIRVGANSRAGIILVNETLLRLDENSAITLTEVVPQTPSLLDMLKGIVHFISRVPRSLKVNTPFVNAAIEGTEFVVAVSATDTTVTVFEGKVLTSNDLGEVRITPGETSVTAKGAAPHKTLLAKPRDVVQWALYFPPVFDQAQGHILQAQQLLAVGRVEEARKLLAADTSAQAKALQTVIAVVNNDQPAALQLAHEAVAGAPDVAATHIAFSYAWQASLDLNMALASAQQAVKVEPGNALAWARLAELQLSTGKLTDAQQAANEATRLNPEISRTQTILGYAYLTRIDIDNAMTAFDKAIQLDQADPLPRLGLGLAKIRRNHLAEGRRDIEIAASLDPNNAIIRSYLGKAYYEEKRAPLDADQYAMAKQLDPNDPTPYYYDAIRKQTENNPGGALEDLNKSIELNDNRAVYRSSLQLDQDAAARSASLARFYSDLGFEQLSISEATNSLANDPANHSALRFLSDSYANLPRHEIARASSLLQSQMLQPLNSNPIQPHLRETNLSILSSLGPSSTGLNEYNPLFTRNQLQATATISVGNNSLIADEILLSGLYDKLAFSVSQFSYNMNGFRANSDINHDITNAFVQYKLTDNIDIQFEYINRWTDEGDLRLSLEPYPEFDPTNRGQLDEETSRVGIHYTANADSDVLFSYINNKRHANADQGTAPITFHTVTEPESHSYELQYLKKAKLYNLVLGAGTNSVEGDTATTVLFAGMPVAGGTPVSLESDQYNTYLYSSFNMNDTLNLIAGVSYDNIDRVVPDRKTSKINPKLGLIWKIQNNLNLRLAGFQTVKRNLVSNLTLEPTEVAGFNQFYDDFNDTVAKIYGLGLDAKLTSSFYSGLEIVDRNLDIPYTLGSSTAYNNQDELFYRIYLNWVFSKYWSTSLGYKSEDIKRSFDDPTSLNTASIPLSIQYTAPNGFFGLLRVTHVSQEGNYVEPVDVTYSSNFELVDLVLGYRLPKRQGIVSLQINNLFNQSFYYQDHYPYQSDYFSYNPEYIPELTAFVRFTLNF